MTHNYQLSEFKSKMERRINYPQLVRELHHDLLEYGLKLVATETDPGKLVLFVRNLRIFSDLCRLVLDEDYQATTEPDELL